MPTADTAVSVQPSIVDNPAPGELRERTAAMPNARRTEFDNCNVETRVVARSSRSTFIVDDDPSAHSDRCIPVAEGRRVARLQDEYMAGREILQIDGYIGSDPEHRVAARLRIEASNANIAAMQQVLYFEPGRHAGEPQLKIIYTPNLPVDGYPDERLIAVYLDQGVTRVFHSDYFGESKKAGLRMWNKIVYDRGGLPLHAGCKVIPVGDRRAVGLIIGLSGTGKTTTTFTTQNGSLPVQDDFVALMPDGRVYATEDGCFAKTYELGPSDQPEIYGAVTRSDAYLENVSQQGEKIDFCDDTYTQNGRAVFPMSSVRHAAAGELERADFIIILNRNDNIIPAVAKIAGPQAAAFFMLGETKGTSAGGAAEAGKFLRIPGTNPFFPLLHSQQGNRFRELLDEVDLDVYLMNTGRVGGDQNHEHSRKVEIAHSSAIVKGIAERTIEWRDDPDFAYQVAAGVPGIEGDDELLLRPRELYEAQGRGDEHAAIAERIREDRLEYLRGWPGLEREIIESLA